MTTENRTVRRAVGGEPFAVTLSGRRFDCGSQEGFVAATIHEYARRGGTIDLGAAGRR